MKKFVAGLLAAVMCLGLILSGCSKKPEQAVALKKSPKIGSLVKFGTYEGEDMEWYVLDSKKKSGVRYVTLISAKGIAAKAFNDEYTETTWENSSLRKWLNGEFKDKVLGDAIKETKESRDLTITISEKGYVDYFSAEYQAQTETEETEGTESEETEVGADGDAEQKEETTTAASAQTVPKLKDFVVIPAEEDLANVPAKIKAMSAAKEGGAEVLQDGTCQYWLREPGKDSKSMKIMNYSGKSSLKGAKVNNPYIGVRVMIEIEIQ